MAPRTRRWVIVGVAAAVAVAVAGVVVATGGGGKPAAKPSIDPNVLQRLLEDRNAFIDGDQPTAAAEWFNDSRGGPQGSLPVDRYVKAKRQVEAILEQLRELLTGGGLTPQVLRPGAVTSSWEWLGPANVGGRTRALVIDPRNPSVIFGGGIQGGVWKTTDGGGSWRPLTDTLSNIAVSTLEMDPRDPSVMYAGTGDGVYSYRDWFRGNGILLTRDGGGTWSFLPSTRNVNFHYVNAIQVSPNDSHRLYATTRAGVFRSVDGGAHWAQVFNSSSPDGCFDLVVRDDRSPDVLLTSCGGIKGADGVYQSVNGGDTWTRVIGGSSQLGAPVGYASLAIAPSDQDVMYASVAREPGDQAEDDAIGLLRSTTGGGPGTWQVRNKGDNSTGNPDWLIRCDAPDSGPQGWYDNVIAVDPTNPDRFWVGGIDLYRSDDGGHTLHIGSYWWLNDQLRTKGQPSDGTQYAHADQHVIVFDPRYDGTTNRTVYFGDDGGIFRTDDDRASVARDDCPHYVPFLGYVGHFNQVRYRSLSHGYGVTQFWGGAVSDDGDLLAGGSQDNGTLLASTGSGRIVWSEEHPGDGGNVAIAPDGTVYAANPGGFTDSDKSINLYRRMPGSRFLPITAGISDGAKFVTPFVLDPNDPKVLWVGGTRMWRSTDGGTSWKGVSPDFAGDPQDSLVTTIAVAPGDGNVVYVGLGNGGVYRTTNALAANPTWFTVKRKLPPNWIGSLAIDPVQHDTVYASVKKFGVVQIWKTTDAGDTWHAIENGLADAPVSTLAINPLNHLMVYAGTDAGVFESLDGGATWTPANENLATTIVQKITFRTGTSEMYVFTLGRGVYRVDVGGAAPPPNDAITAATEATLAPGFTARTNTRYATSDPSDPSMTCGAAVDRRQRRTVWYRAQPGTAGAFTVSTKGTNYDSVVAVWSGTPGHLIQVACDDDSIAPGGPSQLRFDAEAGATYYVEVALSSDAKPDALGGTLVLSVSPA